MKTQELLTSKEYNKIVNERDSNCLAFAFSQTTKRLEEFDLLTIQQIEKLKNHQRIEEIDICEAFIKKAKSFGYEVKPVTTLTVTHGKVIFIVLGWYSQNIEGFGNYDYSFHIIRKNKDDSFEHKLDWYTPAEVVSNSKLNKWFKLDIAKYYFVLS